MLANIYDPAELPVLDISETTFHPSTLSSIAEACREWGFFHISNHGISDDLIADLLSLSKTIFRLPSESKLKLGPSSSFKTYVPHFIASPFFESFKVSGPDFFASAQSSATILFDEHDSQFGQILQEYGSKMEELSKKIVKILLMSMGEGFETKYLDQDFRNCHGHLRLNNYSSSPCPEIEEEEEKKKLHEREVEGLGIHTDTSCITILYQDQSGGLQVRSSDGKWMEVSPCSGTLVVNVGDLFQAWSNDRMRSSAHRVILKTPVANRFSVAFFWSLEGENVILSPEEVVGEGNKRVYRPFVYSDYLKFRGSAEKVKFGRVGFNVRDFAAVKE